jgi:hypothetical protein
VSSSTPPSKGHDPPIATRCGRDATGSDAGDANGDSFDCTGPMLNSAGYEWTRPICALKSSASS